MSKRRLEFAQGIVFCDRQLVQFQCKDDVQESFEAVSTSEVDQIGGQKV
jgi:hypothetical protein